MTAEFGILEYMEKYAGKINPKTNRKYGPMDIAEIEGQQFFGIVSQISVFLAENPKLTGAALIDAWYRRPQIVSKPLQPGDTIFGPSKVAGPASTFTDATAANTLTVGAVKELFRSVLKEFLNPKS